MDLKIKCPTDMVFVRIELADTYKALKVGWPEEVLAATLFLPILSISIYIVHGVCDMYFDFLRSFSLFPVISKVQMSVPFASFFPLGSLNAWLLFSPQLSAYSSQYSANIY